MCIYVHETDGGRGARRKRDEERGISKQSDYIRERERERE